MSSTKLLMTFPVSATSHTLVEYRERGGYATLEKVLRQMTPTQVNDEITASGIQGRGGAAFPMGRKWGVIHLNDGQPHYLCANADEGEPGTFKDRWILENAPHLLVESMVIAAYALQVRNAFVYMRGEFDLPYRRLAASVDEAYEAGYLGERILGTDVSCDLVIYRGAGSYVCGEASALLTSIEGRKPYPRNRPPRLTVRGLYQRPTVVNNVETLANIVGIVANGAQAFRAVGTAKNPGTRLISISGHICRPGVYEIEIGYPWSKFIYEDCGGVSGGRQLKAVIPGGSSAKVLKAGETYKVKDRTITLEDIPMDFDTIAACGSMAGSGGVIVMDDSRDMVECLNNINEFYAHESCGQCTPCREGSLWMKKITQRMLEGGGVVQDPATLKNVADNIAGRTICALGDAAALPVKSFIKHFRDEFQHHIDQKKCLVAPYV